MGGKKGRTTAYPGLGGWPWGLKHALAASTDLIMASPYVLDRIRTVSGLSGQGRWPGLGCSRGIVV